jgi:hypothetical protein
VGDAAGQQQFALESLNDLRIGGQLREQQAKFAIGRLVHAAHAAFANSELSRNRVPSSSPGSNTRERAPEPEPPELCCEGEIPLGVRTIEAALVLDSAREGCAG